jgi:hypothetical protein
MQRQTLLHGFPREWEKRRALADGLKAQAGREQRLTSQPSISLSPCGPPPAGAGNTRFSVATPPFRAAYWPSTRSQTPAATRSRPEILEISRPVGTTFSRRTMIAMPPIQAMFMTPPTKRRAIKAQQQPKQ